MTIGKYPPERCSLVSPPGLQKRDGTGSCPDGFLPAPSPPLDVAGVSGNSVFVEGPWPPPASPSWPSIQEIMGVPAAVPNNTRVHRLWLRDDFEVEIRLPADLKHDEQQRLMDFVTLLLCQ